MSKVDPHRPQGAEDQPSPPAHAPILPAARPVAVKAPLAGPPAAAPAGQALPPLSVLPAAPAVSPMAPYVPQAPGDPTSAPTIAPAVPIRPAVVAAPTAPVPVRPLAPQPVYVPQVSARPTAGLPVAAAPARPIALGSNGAPQIQATASAEDEADLSENAVKSAPPFLVSMVVHMALVIVLALITFQRAVTEQLQLSAVYAESLGQQLIDDRLQSPQSLDMQVETPALSFDLTPANDPFAAPPKLPDVFLDPNKATSNLDAPSIGLALTGREHGMKQALLPAYGGTATTESAVLAGLEWLKRNQMKDGGWSLAGPFVDGTYVDNRIAATAMALLAFQGAGHTHQSGNFQKEVQRGWDYLLRHQDLDGFFKPDESGQQQLLYAQAQATIAICELYGMTKDDKYKRPAQLALQFCQKAQSPEYGGWRYQPREDSDLSVTGWFVMAFQSGRMAGLDVHSDMLERISKFLDMCATREDRGARYAYKPGEGSKLSMTAEGLLCRQYLGWKYDDERLRRGVDYLLQNLIDYHEQNVYYWYYATQVCHHMDGDDWNRWNRVMRQEIPTNQIKTGSERGSWPPHGDDRGSAGGRLYVTCLSIFMLETYYRHLPIYKWRLQ